MTEQHPNTAVVVGMDGSEPSRRALTWAVQEASQRAVPLRILHAFPFDHMVAPDDDPHVQQASQRLRDVAEQARGSAGPGLEVTSAVVDGLPAKSLVEESHRSALLVVGSRGHGGFASLMLGSTSVDVTAHAACPVVVVPDGDVVGPTQDAPVVVGVDASADSRRALAFAFARAAARQASVLAVHAWRPPTAYGAYSAGVLRDTNRLAREAETTLRDAVAPWLEVYPGVEVEQRVVRGHSVAELARLSGPGADVVAVGSRGRTPLTGMLLGSVSQGLLRHAGGPVVVVH